jgi:hypothetical protein
LFPLSLGNRASDFLIKSPACEALYVQKQHFAPQRRLDCLSPASLEPAEIAEKGELFLGKIAETPIFPKSSACGALYRHSQGASREGARASEVSRQLLPSSIFHLPSAQGAAKRFPLPSSLYF